MEINNLKDISEYIRSLTKSADECPECKKFTLEHVNHISPPSSIFGEQEVISSVCTTCGYSEWD